MPKTVAPDPDIRANMQSGSRGEHRAPRSRSPAPPRMAGSIQVVPRLPEPEHELHERDEPLRHRRQGRPLRRLEPAEDAPVSIADAGIDEHQRHRRQRRHRRHPLADPLHPRRARQHADRHVGAETGAERRPAPRMVRPSRQIRLRRRSVAAASAEPPPSPAATGRLLGEVEPDAARDAVRERPGSGASATDLDEIVLGPRRLGEDVGEVAVNAQLRPRPRRGGRRSAYRRARRRRRGCRARW